jgi:hypothetical protein
VQAFAAVEKSLDAYLDTKKLAFPRFFFLSNDELLEILSETKDPVNIQPFAKKCFEAVASLTFQPDLTITGCTSIEGEALPYDAPVDTKGESNGVEQWLLQARPFTADSRASGSAYRLLSCCVRAQRNIQSFFKQCSKDIASLPF